MPLKARLMAFGDYVHDARQSPACWVSLLIGVALGTLICAPLIGWALPDSTATILAAGFGSLFAVSAAAWMTHIGAKRDEYYARNQLLLFIARIKAAARMEQKDAGDWVSNDASLTLGLFADAQNHIRAIQRSNTSCLAELRGLERVVDKMRPTLSPCVEELRHHVESFDRGLANAHAWASAHTQPTIRNLNSLKERVDGEFTAFYAGLISARMTVQMDALIYARSMREDFEEMIENFEQDFDVH